MTTYRAEANTGYENVRLELDLPDFLSSDEVREAFITELEECYEFTDESAVLSVVEV